MFPRFVFRRMAARRIARRMIRRRIMALLILLALGGFALRAHAQAAPAGVGDLTPDQIQALQDQFAQMRDIQDQVVQNMQNAGVDPQQFMQDVGQQMQDGTLDMAGLQQMMVQKGYMTQQMSDQLSGSLNSLQGTMRNVSLNAVKDQLNASDEEWAVILPRIQKILDLKQSLIVPSLVGSTRGGFGGGGLGGAAMQPANTSEVGKDFKDLQTVLQDPNAAEDRIATKLAAWRQARDKAQGLLKMAQDDLLSVLTLRQEAILLNIGIL